MKVAGNSGFWPRIVTVLRITSRMSNEGGGGGGGGGLQGLLHCKVARPMKENMHGPLQQLERKAGQTG